jgi:hypothetical protein
LDANKFRTRDLEIAIRQALNIDEFPSGYKRKASDEIIVKKKVSM